MLRRFGLFVMTTLGIGLGCSLTTDLGGLSGGDDPADSATSADAPSADGPRPLDGAPSDGPTAEAAADAGPPALSCATSGPGADHSCGSTGKEDCCESLLVPGGSFSRNNNDSFKATVSAFRLDRYEVTLGRLVPFVTSSHGTQATPPSVGDGAHPKIAGSGWQASFNSELADDTNALIARLNCYPDQPPLDAPAACIDWYTAFAFCIWDGGRLPTDAEWNYAAAGGGQQRVYPWSQPPGSTTIDPSYATYTCPRNDAGDCQGSGLSPVGAHSPKGDARWGHADLAGNAIEWLFDYRAPFPAQCTDCANLIPGMPPNRADRDFGTVYGAGGVMTTQPNDDPPALFSYFIGFRCVRDP